MWLLVVHLLVTLKTSQGQLFSGSRPTDAVGVVTAVGGAMMEMPVIKNLDVDCEKSGMTVHVQFTGSFNGIIFSKGHYNDPSCRYVHSGSGRPSFQFFIPTGSCGSELKSEENAGEMSNTLVVQNEEEYQEMWDVARHIKCNWKENFTKKIRFNPFTVGMLTAEESRFESEDAIDCWMDIQLGSYPQTTKITSIVGFGETLSLLIFLRDNKGMYDTSVKDCYAFGGSEFQSGGANTVQLTDENGCVLKEKLISDFKTVREEDKKGSLIVSYASVQAFKFPDSVEVHMTCNMEICKGRCNRVCGGTSNMVPLLSGKTLFKGPVLIDAPDKCLPGSGDSNCFSPKKPTPSSPCFPGTKDSNCRKQESKQEIIQKPLCTKNSKHPLCISEPNCQVDFLHPKCVKTVKPSFTCLPNSNDPKCQKATTQIFVNCPEGSTDPRCPQKSTTSKPNCFRFPNDPKCSKPKAIIKNASQSQKPSNKLCQLGSKDAICHPQSRLRCSPGTNDPRCFQTFKLEKSQCLQGSNDQACISNSSESPKPLCFVGSNDPTCHKPIEIGRSDCIPSSNNPKCQDPIVLSISRCSSGKIGPKCLEQNKVSISECQLGSTKAECKNTSVCIQGSNDPSCVTNGFNKEMKTSENIRDRPPLFASTEVPKLTTLPPAKVTKSLGNVGDNQTSVPTIPPRTLSSGKITSRGNIRDKPKSVQTKVPITTTPRILSSAKLTKPIGGIPEKVKFVSTAAPITTTPRILSLAKLTKTIGGIPEKVKFESTKVTTTTTPKILSSSKVTKSLDNWSIQGKLKFISSSKVPIPTTPRILSSGKVTKSQENWSIPGKLKFVPSSVPITTTSSPRTLSSAKITDSIGNISGKLEFESTQVPITTTPRTLSLGRPTKSPEKDRQVPKSTTQKPSSPNLKPKASTIVKSKVLSKPEPKPKPEPSGKEWVGNPRFHPFHSYHFDKGDGRRTGKRLIKSFGRRPKREAAVKGSRTVTLTSAILVAPSMERRSRPTRYSDQERKDYQEILSLNENNKNMFSTS